MIPIAPIPTPPHPGTAVKLPAEAIVASDVAQIVEGVVVERHDRLCVAGGLVRARRRKRRDWIHGGSVSQGPSESKYFV